MPRRKKDSFLLEVLDEQDALSVDSGPIRIICEKILEDAKVHSGRLGIVLVDSDTIQQYNRDFLQHDYPTDVISFPIEDRPLDGYLEGEILACTQIAKERAGEFCWTPEEEILLYVVHGVLHLVGFDDTTPEARIEMRQMERQYLALLGIDVPRLEYAPEWDDDEDNQTEEI